MASDRLFDQLTECAESSRTTIQVGSANLSVETSGWSGKAPAGQMMVISAKIQDGNLGNVLDALTGTFTSSEFSLPDWLVKAAGSIELRHLSAGFERTDGKVNFIAFSFGLDIKTGGWVLVDNLLSITELKADFSILLPRDPDLRQIQLSVGGRLTLGSAPISITARSIVHPGEPPAKNVAELLTKTDLLVDEDKKEYPGLFDALTELKLEKQTRFDLAIEGRLMAEELKNPLTLADVIRQFGWTTSGSPDKTTLDDDPLARIAIRALEMRASTATGSFEFLLDLGEAGKPKELPFGNTSPLKLKDLYLHVEGSADRGLAGTLGCDIELDKNLNVHLQASCDRASGGWIFAGGLELESGSRLVDSIQKTFGIALPEFVKKLEGRPGEKSIVADCEFNTSTSELNLSLQVGLKIGDSRAAARLDIGISPKDNGFVVSGAVILGGKHFDLTYESLGADQGPVLIATYTEQDVEPIDLGSLLASLGGLQGVDLQGVKLAIPGAGFAWQQDKGGRQGVKLVGVNVRGGLDLAAIKVSDYLPLVYDTAEAGISAKLDFQVVLTDRSWTDKDAALRTAIASRGFVLTDAAIGSGVNLRAQLRLGNETRTLDAPALARNGVVSGEIAKKAQKNQPNNPPEPQPDAQDDTHWLDLHRKIGPLRFERIGLQFLTKPDARIALLLDAGFEFSGLQVSIDGLRVESPLSKFDPKFSLSGLGISYRNPAIEIGGALLLIENGFAGKVIVKAKKFSLSAMGVFQVVDPDKQPSLFIYATLDAALGGPPFFYVTGLAAGIGYNRDVLLPEAEGVRDFPLVQWALPDNQKSDKALESPKRDDPLAAIKSLTKVMPVAIGKGFAAIGVHFTSFKVLDSFALLVAKFGPHFELDVLGISTLVSPPGNDAVRVVNATLLLRAKFAPDEGILAVRAVLAADSYVLSQSCHLGGGFAFSAWFRDQLEPKITAGDFVVTLGGYHPEFQRPPHYPTVPRLSLEWSVNENLSLKGSAYFALTGSAVMAGGRFEAAWISEDVRAMFVAQADFLMTWKPYHYDVRVHVAIAAEITLRRFCNFHASLDASADVHLWGPEFSGSVRVHVVVLGFDLPLDAEFGHGAPKPKAIDWPLFRKSFLPEPKNGTIFAFGVRSGLLGAEPEPPAFPIVSRNALTLAFETPIPLSEMPFSKAGGGSLSQPAIAPMGLASKDFTSQLQVEFWFGEARDTAKEHDLVELAKDEGGAPKCEGGAVVRKLSGSQIGLMISPIRKAMPAAIWGPSITSDAPDGGIYLEHQPPNAAPLVENLVVGFEIVPFAVLSAVEMAKSAANQANPFKRTLNLTKDEVSAGLLAPTHPPGTTKKFSMQAREELLRAYGLTPEVIAA